MNKIVAATLLSALLAVPALAGEGGRDPFPFTAGGEITTAAPQGFDVGRAALPNLPQAYSFAFNGVPTNAPNGQETEVATANSLPRNAMVGTIEYAQERAVARWFASRPGLRNVAVAPTGRSGT